MKIVSKLLVLSAFVSLSGLGTSVQAGPSGPSARMAARLKKYPTSQWLAHYLPDDRYKIAGGVWKYVSTDLDTYYHRPESAYMMSQPAGRVIGFSSAAEAEEAGYRPDPNLDSFPAVMVGSSTSRTVSSAQRVILGDGSSSLLLPAGWSRSKGPGTSSQYVSSVSDFFTGPRGERFQVAILNLKLPASSRPLDLAQFTNVRFFNSLKSNGGTSASIDRMAQNSGVINSQLSGRNGLSQLSRLDNFKISAVRLGGIAGVGAISIKPIAGQPNRTYTMGRGSKLWNISDFSRGQTLTLILRSLQLR